MAAKPKKDRGTNKPNREEERVTNLVNDVLEFEKFREEILPKIRQMIAEGKSSDEILAFGEAYASARTVTTAILSRDDKTALLASKDILDRTRGRATESKKVEHRFEQLPDQELDAVLAGKLAKLAGEADEDEKIH